MTKDAVMLASASCRQQWRYRPYLRWHRTSQGPTNTMLNAQVKSYGWVPPNADHVRRTVMISVRDGTKLFTMIVLLSSLQLPFPIACARG